MAYRLQDFERRNEGQEVVLIHRPTDTQVRFSAWDARVLPFVDGAADHADVVARAHAAGVKVPVDHVRVVVERLQKAAILCEVSSEPMALGDGDTPPSGGALNLSRANKVFNDPLPAPAQRPAPVLDEEPRSEREELEAIIANGQENLRREVRRMNRPLDYAPIPVVQSRKPSSAPVRRPSAAAPAPAARLKPVVDVPEELPEAGPAAPAAPAADEPASDDRPALTAAALREADARAAAAAAQAFPTRAPEPAGPPWHQRHRRPLKYAGIAVAALAVVAIIPLPGSRRTPVLLSPLELAELRAPIDAQVQAVHVQLGAPVEASALLVTLTNPEFLQQVKDFEARVAMDEEELRKLSLGDRPDVVRQEEAIKERSAAAKVAIAEFQKAQGLAAEGKMTAAQVLDAEVALAAAKRSLVEAHARLNDLKQLDLPAEIRGRAQMLERAKQKLAEDKAKLSALEVRAPSAGTVVGLKAVGAAGARVLSGDILAEVGDVRQMRLLFRFPEDDAPYLSTGRPMELTLEDGKTLQVRLQKLSFSRDTSNAREFTVAAVVDNAEAKLRSGMSGRMQVPVGFSPLFRRLLAARQ